MITGSTVVVISRSAIGQCMFETVLMQFMNDRFEQGLVIENVECAGHELVLLVDKVGSTRLIVPRHGIWMGNMYLPMERNVTSVQKVMCPFFL